MLTEHEDTIAAISTPPGEGGVGIVRLSGGDAVALVARCFQSARGKDIRFGRDRVYYGHITGGRGETLDEVLVHIMRAPHSYTREDVVEINCHGGAGPLNAVFEETLRQGARIAAPGEFTRRAFLNGRIDLIQAEAVIDRIRARTRAGLAAANAAASGTLSKALFQFRDDLAQALARIEAAVDFPEEDLPELVDDALFDTLRSVYAGMCALLDTAEAGRLYREGATIAIVGRPNVGKSSLFNALLRDARAIVTSTAGTTRDRLEEVVNLRGIPARLVDTAGLRSTDDEVERIGVGLARQALEQAQIVLLVLDATAPETPDDLQLAEELRALGTPVAAVLNKTDLAPRAALPGWTAEFDAALPVSALTGAGLGVLEDRLAALLTGGVQVSAGQAMLTRAHQKDSLRRAAENLAHLLGETGASPEFLALDLREALAALGEITGETTPEDILDTIFSTFCIGK